MFTVDTNPQATRSVIGVVPFQILSALGFIYLLHLAAGMKRALYLLCIGIGSVIILYSLAQFASLYFSSYVTYSSDYWGWQYGARPVMEYFVQHRSQYDDMYMSPDGFNAPEIFTSFYDPTDRCAGKCRIGNTDHYQSGKKQLFAIPADHMNSEGSYLHVVRIIYYPNTKPAFFIAETL
jgi:hypothetical protein